MREIICANIGQAGVQLSNSSWELFCTEHGIKANGRLKDHLLDTDSTAFKTFFQETPRGQYIPRAVTVDLESTVIDEIRTGHYRNLFHEDQLISGFEDASNNYARGHFTLGKQLINNTTEVIRLAVDACDMLQGFLIFCSLGGGTGSGFTDLLLERLATEYGKSTKFQIVVIPSSELSTAIVEPYNAVLCVHSSVENSEICSMFDNESVFKICTNELNVVRPTFSNINRILSQVFSSLTVSLRYESLLNSDMDQLATNLIPYPRIHFPVTCFAPIMSVKRAEHDTLNTIHLTRMLFERKNQMICCNMDDGKYISCCLQYRGDVTPKDVNTSIFDIKKRTDIKFVNWCPTGFKLGISSQPPTIVPSSEMAQSSRNVTMITNSTAVHQVWLKLNQKFDILFSKRSFVHWYVGEGMEEGEFNEAKDEVDSIVADYIEIGIDEEDDEETLNPEVEEENKGQPVSVASENEKQKSEEINPVSEVEETNELTEDINDNEDVEDESAVEN